MTIDDVVNRIATQLKLEAETEFQVLDEIRCHLEEAVEDARVEGIGQEEALARAAAHFGVEEVVLALQATHEGWGALEGIAAAALPVVSALVLRWLVFAPDGTFVGWREMMGSSGFWFLAVVALVVPVWRFPRHRYALVAWAVFWGLSVITIAGGGVRW